MIKICPNCKIKFKSANKRKIYCSDKCQRVFYRKSPAGKIAAKKWEMNNKEWRKNYKKTDVWKNCKKRYENGEASKERYKRYRKSEKGKKVVKRYRAKEDVKVVLKIRSNISKVFRRLNITKDKTSFKYLGCTVEKFKKHIEAQFQPGMSWDNHGVYGWHFDHIKPVDSFNLNFKSEREKCNNYKNFQPMWANENIKKSNKLNYNGGNNV